MKLIFLTDLHIDVDGEHPQGVDVREHVRRALAYTVGQQPDALIIGGDICNKTGDRAIYEWTKRELDRLPFPYYVIAGNHDDSGLLADVFGLQRNLHGTELYYALPLNGHPALFLDSAAGELSAEQWTWLREHLLALGHSNVLIFMHHPPVPAGSQFMDATYPFRQPEPFLELIRELPGYVTVVCGHYHTERLVQRDNLLVLLTPSTYLQLRTDTPGMAIDHQRIGLRELTLTGHGLTSVVHYAD